MLNSLNVFPVPDSDTGSNMCATFFSGLEKIRQSEYSTVSALLSDFSLACLMGARGNSGVILSLAVKGFSSAASEELTGSAFLLRAMENAVELCYESISSPKEGTALTVLKSCLERLRSPSLLSAGFEKALSEVCVCAAGAVAKTKELLPELQNAGVVDAGAKGIFLLLEGLREGFAEKKTHVETPKEENPLYHTDTDAEIKNKFCCEFVIRGEKPISPKELEKLGDSAATVFSDGIIKLHLHSNFPHRVLELASSRGEIINGKIENMVFQHNSSRP